MKEKIGVIYKIENRINGKFGKDNPCYGQKRRSRTIEEKKKISESLKGNIIDEETKRKISKSLEGNKNSLGKNKGIDNNNYDFTIYCFVHPVYGKEICTRHDLYTKYNLNKSNLNALIHGRYKSCHGWSLIS